MFIGIPKDYQGYAETDAGLKKGLNIVNGKIVFPAVAEAFGWEM